MLKRTETGNSVEPILSRIGAIVAFTAVLAVAVLISLVNPEQPTKTNLCELKSHPERFNGKIVQVRAAVITSMEIGGLQDATCSAWVHLAFSSDTYMSGHQREQFAFVPAIRDPNNLYQLIWNPSVPKPATWDADHPPLALVWRPVEIPRLVFTFENAEMRRLVRYSGAKYTKANGRRCWHCPLYRTAATVIGRFDHSDTPLVAFRAGTMGKASYHFAGFGHLNGALSQLVVQSVSDVVAMPIDASVYANER
jgi:hypothetical protein